MHFSYFLIYCKFGSLFQEMIFSGHVTWYSGGPSLNQEAQENEQEKPLILITFNHLYELDLSYTHSDYVRQFLSEKNTRLPCLANLKIDYRQLVTVTNHFTNDMARLNCSKITSLEIYTQFDRTENFHSYFPSLCKS